jgi:hypothetical protein
MIPFVRDGDIVHVRPVAHGDVRVGDVVAYASAEAFLLHRVVAERPGGWLLRGDALDFADFVPREAVLGRAVAVVRRGRWRRLDTAPSRWLGRVVAALPGVVPRLVRVARAARHVRTRSTHA